MLRAVIGRHPALAAVMAAALVGFGTFGVATGAHLTVSYLLIVSAGALFVARLDGRVRFSRLTLVSLTAWAVGHLAGGLIGLGGDRILYNALLPGDVHVDNVVHFIGFGAAGLACWEAAQPHFSGDAPRAAPFVTVWLAAMGLGAFNEVVEFAATHLLSATQVGGYENTGRDLVANALGGAAYGVVALRRRWRTPQPDVADHRTR